MPNPIDLTPGIYGSAPPDYGPNYFNAWPGQLKKFFTYKPDRDIPRAQAIADAIGLTPGDQILDFGCGLGAMTAAFTAAGYPTVGVDTSSYAVCNAIPEAQGRVKYLGDNLSLSDLPNDMVRLVIAKEVFEHLPEDTIHEILDELICIGRQVAAIIPTTDQKGSFLFDQYNKDPTHITRLTQELWLGRFAYRTARNIKDISDLISQEDKTPGTMCLLLEESNREFREVRMRERIRAHTPMWRQLIGLPPSRFSLDFDSLLAS